MSARLQQQSCPTGEVTLFRYISCGQDAAELTQHASMHVWKQAWTEMSELRQDELSVDEHPFLGAFLTQCAQ